MDYAHTGTTFATGGKDNTVRVYDEETKVVKTELRGIKWQTHGHSNRIQAVKFMPDDANIIASGGWDQNVHVISSRSIFGILGKATPLLQFLDPRSQVTRLILEIIYFWQEPIEDMINCNCGIGKWIRWLPSSDGIRKKRYVYFNTANQCIPFQCSVLSQFKRNSYSLWRKSTENV